jgi:5-methylcytosine-specific restriction endonuclease McrA
LRYRQRHGRQNARSAYIRKGLKYVVFFADRWRCAACKISWAEAGHLEIDHVLPWSLGGLTTLFNCMALCPRCNKIKSNFWRYRRSHRTVYVPFPGAGNPSAAEAILRAELRHRWNLFRLLRAAWALG